MMGFLTDDKTKSKMPSNNARTINYSHNTLFPLTGTLNSPYFTVIKSIGQIHRTLDWINIQPSNDRLFAIPQGFKGERFTVNDLTVFHLGAWR